MKKLESKQNDVNKTEKNNSNIIKQNVKTTIDATTQTETQTEDQPLHFQRSQHTMIQRHYIKVIKKDIYHNGFKQKIY